MHQGQWNRFFGKRREEVTVGIIGTGRHRYLRVKKVEKDLALEKH